MKKPDVPCATYATMDRRDLEDVLIQIMETAFVDGYRCATCDARDYTTERQIVHSSDCRYMQVTNQLMNALGVAAQLKRLPDGGWSACFYDGTERRLGSAQIPSAALPRTQNAEEGASEGNAKPSAINYHKPTR